MRPAKQPPRRTGRRTGSLTITRWLTMPRRLKTLPWPRAFRWLAIGLLLGVVAGIRVHFIARTPPNHDEAMYLAAGARIAAGETPYIDFAYVQTPYWPYVYGALFDLLDVDRHVFAAQAATLTMFAFMVACVAFAAWRQSKSAWLAGSIAVLMWLDPILLRVAAIPSNHMPCAALALAGTLLFGVAFTSSRGHWRAAGSGFLMAVAVGVKLYALPLLLMLGLASLLWGHSGRWRRTVFYGAGVVAGLTPLGLLWATDPDAFWFNNIEYHQLNALYIAADSERTSIAERFLFTIRRPRSPTLSLVCGAIVVLQLPLIWGAIKKRSFAEIPATLSLTWLGLLTTFVSALVPVPSHMQYGSLFLPFLYAALAMHAYGATPWPRRGVIAVMTASLMYASPFFLSYARTLRSNLLPTAEQTYQTGQSLREALEQRDVSGPIATLEPQFAVEAGWPFLREFATGVFTFRVADRVAKADQRTFHIVGPKSCPERFQTIEPAAIFVRGERKYTKSFVRYARAQRMAGVRAAEGIVYVPRARRKALQQNQRR